MIGNSNQENLVQQKNPKHRSVEKLEQRFNDRLRETMEYVEKMSVIVTEPQPFLVAPYGGASSAANPAEIPYDPRISYFQEFWKIYIRNQNRLNQIKVLASESAILREKVTEIETIHNQIESLTSGMISFQKKKNRRLAADIDKRFRCPYENCYKLYGSNVSLNLHIKLKHNGGNKTDRQKFAQQICMAEISKTPIPVCNITFPPGFLEAYRKEFLRTLKKEIRI